MKSLFQGKTALITGAARGIGAATAKKLAECGAAVIVADLNEEQAKTTAQEIIEAGGKAEALLLNVADFAAIEEKIAQAKDILARLPAQSANPTKSNGSAAS